MLVVTGNTLTFNGKTYRCAIGKGGFSADKKEGDGCTPIGTFALRECWYRPDKLIPPNTALPLKAIHEDDGWCDDPKSAEYNRHIKIPSPPGRGKGEGRKREEEYSYEHLFRADSVYDFIIPLGYNDAPPVAGKGSAIFLHIARENYEGTEGCVALAKADLLEILPLLSTQAAIIINAI